MDAFPEFLFEIRRTVGRPGLEFLDPERDRDASSLGRARVEFLFDARHCRQQAQERERYVR
jgi:hypothetical protein